MEPKLDLRVVLGGETMKVELLDGSTEDVKVRYLPVASYPEFALALEDEVHQVALFCGRDRAWAEQLHPKSHNDLMRRGHELNLDFFEQWVSRRKRALAAADPAAEARMLRIVEEVVREKLEDALQRPGSASPASSPASRPHRNRPRRTDPGELALPGRTAEGNRSGPSTAGRSPARLSDGCDVTARQRRHRQRPTTPGAVPCHRARQR